MSASAETFYRIPKVSMPYVDWIDRGYMPLPAQAPRRPFPAKCYQHPCIPKVVESKPRPKPPVVAPKPRPKPKPTRPAAVCWWLVKLLAIPSFIEDAIRHHSLTPWPPIHQ